MSTISVITFPFIDSALHYQAKLGVALDQQTTLEEAEYWDPRDGRPGRGASASRRE